MENTNVSNDRDTILVHIIKYLNQQNYLTLHVWIQTWLTRSKQLKTTWAEKNSI